MVTPEERLRHLRKEKRLSQQDLADLVDKTKRTIQRWESEKDDAEPSRGELLIIEETTGFRHEWLRTGEEPMRLHFLDQNGDELQTSGVRTSPSLSYIPLATVSASAGEGEEPFHPEIEAYVAYDTATIRRITGVQPDRLVLIPVTGNSMDPTLRAGEVAWVVKYDGEPILDGTIYVLNRRYQGVMIKRAFWQEGGTLLLRGDNPDEPHPMTLTPGDESEWVIIGRVVRVEKNL